MLISINKKMADTIRYTLSLPQPLNFQVKNLARSLGLPVATFIRYLVIEEVKKASFPTFLMSRATEKIVTTTDKLVKQNKLKEFTTTEEMFEELNRELK